MLKLIGTDCEFRAFFTKERTGYTGLTVTVDVYDPDGDILKTGQAATELDTSGLYAYTLPAADFVEQGPYTAVFKTATIDADLMHVPAQWECVGSLDLSETGDGDDLDDTLAGLRDMLRIRLNDLDRGNYLTRELDYCINLGYRETVVNGKCHREREEIALTAGTHTYDFDPIFHPIEATLDDIALDTSNLKGVGIKTQGWDATANGTPDTVIQLTGSTFRIHPTPDTTAATDKLIVHGWAYPDALTEDTDRPVAIPVAYRVQTILDRAEAEARKMRSTHAGNLALVEVLLKLWIANVAALAGEEE